MDEREEIVRSTTSEDDDDDTVDMGENEVQPPKKRKKRKVGELSGRQLALKRLEREKGVWKLAIPPPFKVTVEKMREILFEFAEGDEQNL